MNSLIQVVLKCTCPGVPDIYQGTEFLDFSFVDPDNRRAVNYDLRNEDLENEKKNVSFRNLFITGEYDKSKISLLSMLLNDRAQFPGIYSGKYFPLKVNGQYEDRIVAFARMSDKNYRIVIFSINTAAMAVEKNISLTEINWNDTKVILPESFPSLWINKISTQKLEIKNEILISDIFNNFPLCVLANE